MLLAEATIEIEADQAKVFDLFTTEVGLCSWMAQEATIDLRPGGSWRWVHDNGVAASGEYVAVEPHDRVSFTYGWEGGPYVEMRPGSTTVEVTFEPIGGRTRVVVEHAGVPSAFVEAHQGGWTYFLGLLADVAAGRATPGIRLPNTTDFDEQGAH